MSGKKVETHVEESVPQAILPVAVVRKVTHEGAVLHELKLVSQWIYVLYDEPDPDSAMDDTMESLCYELGLAWHSLRDPFIFDEAYEDAPVLTNVLLIRLQGQSAALFNALYSLLECMSPDKDLFGWLRALLALDTGETSVTPVQDLIDEVIKQAVMLNVPRVIPLGKSEAEMV